MTRGATQRILEALATVDTVHEISNLLIIIKIKTSGYLGGNDLHVFNFISFLFVVAAKQINHHTTQQISVFFPPCLLCVCFTSSIIEVFLLSFDWVVFTAICDKAFMLVNTVNKNRIPQHTFTWGSEEVGSKSRNEGCQFAIDKCGSIEKSVNFKLAYCYSATDSHV